jgi:hypothetical protein
MTFGAVLMTLVLSLQTTGEAATAILDRYVSALGGESERLIEVEQVSDRLPDGLRLCVRSRRP